MSQAQLFDIAPSCIGAVEERLRDAGVSSIIGVDEAGRGPLAGPVVAGAYWLNVEESFPPVLDEFDDSKKLTESVRERLFDELCASEHPFSVASTSARVIDEINVLQATFRAMKEAVENVVEARGATPDLVLVDGNMIIPRGPWKQRAIIKGDSRSLAIAAASIVAKVNRDRFMRKADETWPDYGFGSHKGYGTKQHRRALELHGPCELHRRSFAGVE